MEFAGKARTAEELNGFLRLMMKSAPERMLHTSATAEQASRK